MATTTPDNPNTPNLKPRSEFESDASGLKRTLKSEAGDASNAMHDARDAVTGKASQLASEAREGVARGAEDAKRQATESLRTFARTIREAGDKLSESDQGMAAGFVRQAAGGLERLSTSLGEKPFGAMLEDVRNFGRQNPTAFIAGSVLAGLAIGRFVRSSAADGGNGHDMSMGSQSGRTGSSRGTPSTSLGGIGSQSGSTIKSGGGSSLGASSGGSQTKSAKTGIGSSSASMGTGASGAGSSGIADQTRGISGGSGRSGGTSTGGTGRAR